MENSELIDRALKYVDRCYGKSGLTIEEVAKNAGFSVDYFNRIFRAHTGFNVMEYIRFRNLNRAAIKLRQSDADILQIALDAGYESHDGFTRAFKAQYGKTPSEYRREMKDKPVVFADLGMNATAAGRFRAELPEFNVLDSDEVVDYLLNLNARRFGYEAVSIKWNGSCILADRELEKHGCYVAADMFFPDGPYLNLKLRGVSELKAYMDKLIRLKPWMVGVCFDEDTTPDAVKATLDGVKYKDIKANPEAMYFGEPQVLPAEAGEYVFRILEPSDVGLVNDWAEKMPNMPPHKWGLSSILSAPSDTRPNDLPIGMILGNELIGIARIIIDEAHGFRICNCIGTSMLPEYRSGQQTKWLYQYSLNEVLKRNCIPFEDSQFGEYAEEHGGFTATDIGYEIVNTCYTIAFR